MLLGVKARDRSRKKQIYFRETASYFGPMTQEITEKATFYILKRAQTVSIWRTNDLQFLPVQV